jgi:hypothetical protein
MPYAFYTKPGIARQSEAILNSLINTLDSNHISDEFFDRLRRFFTMRAKSSS